MMGKRAIITIVNSLSPTSMDFHEFVLYRVKHYPDELNYFMVLGPIDKDILERCNEMIKGYPVYIYDCQGSYSKYLSEIKKVKQQLINENIPALMHVHMGRSGAAALVCNLFSPKHRVPALFTVHNTRKWATWKSELILPINILTADEVTVVSNYAFKSVPICWRWLKKGHISPLVNGTNVDWIDSVLDQEQQKEFRENISKDVFMMVCICRLSEAKNLPWLIELMAILPDNIQLKIIGDGPLGPRLKKMVQEKNLEHRVFFTGLIPRNQVFVEMSRADLYVSCSLWEGLPISVIEAMATRANVLLSDIGPHIEIAGFGTSVFLQSLQHDKWKAQIETIANMPQEQRRQLGDKNRQIINDNFTLTKMHVGYSKIYENLWQKALKGKK